MMNRFRADSAQGTGFVHRWPDWPWDALARNAFAAMMLFYLVAFIIPQASTILELWREAAELEERQHAARLAIEGAKALPLAEVRVDGPKARDLLPTVSALARQAGMQIVTVKQSGIAAQAEARRIQLRARGEFDGIVSFLDRVLVAIPSALVEDITLRRITESGQGDVRIELEYELSVTSSQAREVQNTQTEATR